MSEREALMRNIVEHPEDDDARLVMADWLDEHGEPARAEFVRLQVSLAHADLVDADVPFPAMTSTLTQPSHVAEAPRGSVRRMHILWEAHRDDWLAEMPDRARDCVHFRRGFPDIVDTTAGYWLRWAARLHRSTPITEVSLQPGGYALARIAQCGSLGRVSSISMSLNSANTAKALHTSPHLGRLRSFRLLGQTGDAPNLAMRDFLRTPWPTLQNLHLSGCSVANDHLDTIADNPASASLVQFTLIHGSSPLQGSILADSPHLRRLACLRIYNAGIDNAALLEFVRSPSLPALAHLWLIGRGIDADGISAIAAEPGLARLRSLVLTRNAIGDRGAIALAESPYSAGLTRLELRVGEIGDAGALALARSPYLAGLRALPLTGNVIGWEARSALKERFGDRVELS